MNRPGIWRQVSPHLPVVLTATSLLVILTATLWPTPDNAHRAVNTPPWCVFCGTRGLVDVVLNTVLFVPLGIGLRLAGKSWRRATLLGMGLSLTVELLQFALIAGRDASLSDLLTNTLGTALGAHLPALATVMVFPTHATARRLAWGTFGLYGAALLGTNYMLQPVVPATAYFWGQWAHVFPDTKPLAGRLIDVTLNRHPVPDDMVRDFRLIKQAFEQDRIEFSATMVGGLPVDGAAQVAAITDGHNGFMVQLEQRHCRFSFSRRVRAATWRLNIPRVYAPAACGTAATDTVHLRAKSGPGSLVIEVNSPTRRIESHLALSPAIGWMLWRPFDVSERWWPWVGMAWLGVFLLPLGYWSCRTRNDTLGMVMTGVAGAAPLVVVSLLQWTAATRPGEAVGATVLLGLGWIVAARLSEWRRRRTQQSNLGTSSTSA